MGPINPMNRSRVFYPSVHGADDGGGAADLQTDVMRFMAILSLCLVAIFALVQSIPLVQSTESPTEPPPQPVIVQTATDQPIQKAIPEPPAPAPRRREAAKPASEKPKPMIATQVPVTQEPSPPAVVDTTPAEAVDTEVPPMPAPLVVQEQEVVSDPVSEEQIGFTLQFENDYALTKLVAANEIGLYAIQPSGALRLSVDGNKPGFWQASLPKQFHEMDASTVPDTVLRALRMSGHGMGDLKWGVTLPSTMSRNLNQYLADHQGGALIIGDDGKIGRASCRERV